MPYPHRPHSLLRAWRNIPPSRFDPFSRVLPDLAGGDRPERAAEKGLQVVSHQPRPFVPRVRAQLVHGLLQPFVREVREADRIVLDDAQMLLPGEPAHVTLKDRLRRLFVRGDFAADARSILIYKADRPAVSLLIHMTHS